MSLKNNTTGSKNTACGYGAINTSTTDDNTTAVGYRAMIYSTGSGNTAVGADALRGSSSGSGGTGGLNVAVGTDSMASANGNAYRNTAVGQSSLAQVSTGYQNVCVGRDAGGNLTTGARNVIVGAEAQSAAAGTNYQTVIGYSLTGKGESTGFIGNSGGGVYQGNNSSTWSTTSDIRIKKNVIDNNTGLDKINQIQVHNFEYKTEEEIIEGSPELTDVVKSAVVEREGTQLGVIAQEIEKVLPDVVQEQSTGIKTVNPDNLTWYLVNAVKELSAENTALKSRLDAAGL